MATWSSKAYGRGGTGKVRLPEGVRLVKLTDGGYLILLDEREIGEIHKDRDMWQIRWASGTIDQTPYFTRNEALVSMVQVVRSDIPT